MYETSPVTWIKRRDNVFPKLGSLVDSSSERRQDVTGVKDASIAAATSLNFELVHAEALKE